MDICMNCLIPIRKVMDETADVLELVKESGKVVILEDNQPSYIIMKYEEFERSTLREELPRNKITLQEAMKTVLLETQSHTLHASELAEIIYNRTLYLRKNGGKAQYTQIRAICGHYPNWFEALPGNYIKLRECIG